MEVLKHVLMSDAFCASPASARIVLKAPLRVASTRYIATRIATQTTTSISSVAKFAQRNTLVKQVTSAGGSTTTAQPKDQKIKEPVREHSYTSEKTWGLWTITLIGQTRRGKARKSSGRTDSIHSDCMTKTSKLTSLK